MVMVMFRGFVLTDHGNYGKIDAPCKKKVMLHAVMRCRLSNSQFHRFIDYVGKTRYQNRLCGVDLHCSLIPRIFVSIGTLALPMIIPRLNLRNPLTQHAVKLTIRVSRFASHQKIQLPFPPRPAFGSALANWTKHLLYILSSLKRWKILDLNGSRKTTVDLSFDLNTPCHASDELCTIY